MVMAKDAFPVPHGGLIDRVAIAVSGLCLIHCLVTALFLALALSAGGVLLDPRIHEIGLMLAIGLGVFAFSQGLAAHRRAVPILAGVMGLCAMGVALLIGHGHSAEVPLTMAGVALVGIGHQLNRRALALVSAKGRP